MENHGDGNSTSFNQFWHTTLTRSSSPAVPGGDSLNQGLIQYRHIDSIEMIHLKLLKLCTVQCTTQTFKVSTGLYFVSHLLSIRFHNFGCNGCVMSKPAEIQFGPWWKNCSKPFTCHSLQRFSSGAAGHTFHLPTCSDLNVGCRNERNELLGQLRRMHSGPNEAVAHAVAATLAPPARCIKVPRAKELSKVSAKVESSTEVSFSLIYLMLLVSFLCFG